MADTQDREEDALGALALNEPLEFVRAGDAHIEIAVRSQNDPVDTLGVKIFLRQLIGILDAFRARRRAACAEPVDGGQDFGLVGNSRRPQRHARTRCIRHDANRVVGLELINQHTERIFHQRQPVLRPHRARHIDEEHKVGAWPFGGLQCVALDADMDELVGSIPGRGDDGDRGLERCVGSFGRGVGVGEIVDHLLDAHRVLLRHFPGIEGTAREGIGGRVDIEREGRDGLGGDLLDAIVREHRQLVAVLLDLNGGGFDLAEFVCGIGLSLQFTNLPHDRLTSRSRRSWHLQRLQLCHFCWRRRCGWLIGLWRSALINVLSARLPAIPHQRRLNFTVVTAQFASLLTGDTGELHTSVRRHLHNDRSGHGQRDRRGDGVLNTSGAHQFSPAPGMGRGSRTDGAGGSLGSIDRIPGGNIVCGHGGLDRPHSRVRTRRRHRQVLQRIEVAFGHRPSLQPPA